MRFQKIEANKSEDDNLEVLRPIVQLATAYETENQQREVHRRASQGRTVVIADDAFKRGNTASAVVEKLLTLGTPPEARVIVAPP